MNFYKDLSEKLHLVANNLESLREENSKLIYERDDNKDDKINYLNDKKILNENIEKIDKGITDADLIIDLINHFKKLEKEKTLFKCKLKRLNETNLWITDELRHTQRKLQDSEQQV